MALYLTQINPLQQKVMKSVLQRMPQAFRIRQEIENHFIGTRVMAAQRMENKENKATLGGV